jgi:hypothetical protein
MCDPRDRTPPPLLQGNYTQVFEVERDGEGSVSSWAEECALLPNDARHAGRRASGRAAAAALGAYPNCSVFYVEYQGISTVDILGRTRREVAPLCDDYNQLITYFANHIGAGYDSPFRCVYVMADYADLDKVSKSMEAAGVETAECSRGVLLHMNEAVGMAGSRCMSHERGLNREDGGVQFFGSSSSSGAGPCVVCGVGSARGDARVCSRCHFERYGEELPKAKRIRPERTKAYGYTDPRNKPGGTRTQAGGFTDTRVGKKSGSHKPGSQSKFAIAGRKNPPTQQEKQLMSAFVHQG